MKEFKFKLLLKEKVGIKYLENREKDFWLNPSINKAQRKTTKTFVKLERYRREFVK